MRKLLPVLALSLSALLLLSLATPAAANPAFPAVGDRLDYELRVDYLAIEAAGPPHYDYDIAVDVSHLIQNASIPDDLYFANITMTYIGPEEIFGPYTGNTTWTAMLHHYQSGEVPHIHPMNIFDWSNFAYYWYTGLFFIEKMTEPGDYIEFGYSDTSDNTTYTYYNLPATLGPVMTVGANQLSTVGLDFTYYLWSNRTIYPTDPFWEISLNVSINWEWSLGFLALITFDFYMNSNPMAFPTGYVGISEFFISGTFKLVDYDLQDTPMAYIGEVPPPGFPWWIPVIIVVIIVCFIIFFLIYRARSKGK